MSYTKRVRYTDSTGQQVMTGLCRDLQDALLKAAMLNGVVVDEDDDVVRLVSLAQREVASNTRSCSG
jgi:hypothetical protein